MTNEKILFLYTMLKNFLIGSSMLLN